MARLSHELEGLEEVVSDQWEPAEQVEAKALDQLKDSYADIADTEAVSAPKMLSKNDARLGGSYPVQDGVTKWVSVDRNTLFTDFTFTIRRSTVVRFAARTTSYRSSASFMIQNEHD